MLTDSLVNKYFPDTVYGEDTFWVADEIGSIFYIADYFFGLDIIIEALELKATSDQLFEYQSMKLNCAMESKSIKINFKNYVKYGEIK